MLYTIEIEGSVPDKIIRKALNMLKGKVAWRKTQRSRSLKSCRITNCFRLIKIGDSVVLKLMDHKHYNHYLTIDL